jgi:diphthamide biosynthesis methyltransferase
MTTSIRHSALENTTGAVVAANGAIVNQGQDYAIQSIDRKIAAIDVGSTAGKTQHASGMIFAEFQGVAIKRVISASVVRTANGFDYFNLGTSANTTKIGFSITNADGKSTLRLHDAAADAPGKLVADDHVIVLLELGNS